MVSDQQVRKLMKLVQSEKTLGLAAAKAGMDEKTARKYRRLGQLPSQCRQDPFAEAWPEIKVQLQINPGLEAKTIFADLQRRYPGVSRMANCALCSGRSRIGESWKVPLRRYFPAGASAGPVMPV